MKPMKRNLIMFGVFFGAISILWPLLFTQNAEAIPAFTRKYKTTCMTCHATFPRLTALGEAIRLNGFKMPDGDELYVKDEPVSLGADAYKKVFPDAVWPSHIPGMPPIALRVIGDFEVDIGDEASGKDSDNKLEFPHELKLLSYGAFGDNMSFFMELEFAERTEIEDAEGNTFEGPKDIDFNAWLMWEDIFIDNAFNIRIGSLGINEIDLPNTRNHRKIHKNNFMYHEKITMGLIGPGIELNGFGKHWRYAGGTIKPEQDAFVDADYYTQVSFKFGGVGYDGSGGLTEEGGLKTEPSGYWRDDSILFGGFYHHAANQIDRYGIDARVNYKDISLAGGFATKDNDTTNVTDDVRFVEASFFAFPWLQPYLLYEAFQAGTANGDENRVIVGTAILARANIKFNVEGKFYTKNEPREAAGKNKDVDDRISVRVDFVW